MTSGIDGWTVGSGVSGVMTDGAGVAARRVGSFVHRPTRVEAVQYVEGSEVEVRRLLTQWLGLGVEMTPGLIWLPSSRGPKQVTYGDWLVRSETGEVWPIHDHTFRLSYASTL